MNIENEKIIPIIDIENKYLNRLTPKKRENLLRFKNRTLKVKGNNKLLRVTLNLIKVNNKIISIDVIYQIHDLSRNNKNYYIKRFYLENGK